VLESPRRSCWPFNFEGRTNCCRRIAQRLRDDHATWRAVREFPQLELVGNSPHVEQTTLYDQETFNRSPDTSTILGSPADVYVPGAISSPRSRCFPNERGLRTEFRSARLTTKVQGPPPLGGLGQRQHHRQHCEPVRGRSLSDGLVKPKSLAKITDGTSNTLMVGEDI
jgi:hypothetical protein